MQNASYTCSHSRRDQYLNQMSDRLISREDGIGFVFAASVALKSGARGETGAGQASVRTGRPTFERPPNLGGRGDADERRC